MYTIGGPFVYITLAFPGNGTKLSGQFGLDLAVYEPSPFQLAIIGPGDPAVEGVGLGDGEAVAIVWDGTPEPPPPEQPTAVARARTDIERFLTPAKVI